MAKSPPASMPAFLPAEASMLPNQSIITPPPPSHYLSAADDLVGRFQLQDSYRVILHPFRKDLNSTAAAAAAASSETRPGEASGSGLGSPATPNRATPGAGNSHSGPRPRLGVNAQAPGPVGLPKTFAHFLPSSLPGKVKPPKPPRRVVVQARRAAVQSLSSQNPEAADGAAGASPSASTTTREKTMAKQQAEWERVSTTLRRVVMKPEYTSADIRPLEEDAIRGFQVEAGEVEEIDRSLLEADAPAGSTPPRKKKKKNKSGGAAGASRSTGAGIAHEGSATATPTA